MGIANATSSYHTRRRPSDRTSFTVVNAYNLIVASTAIDERLQVNSPLQIALKTPFRVGIAPRLVRHQNRSLPLVTLA